MIAAIQITLGQVAATLALVAVAVAVSVWQRADLERDIGIAVVRSFIQLTAIGYVIELIFDQDNLGFVAALLAAMVLFGAVTARSRARKVPRAFWPLLVALAVAGAATLGLVLALGVFEPEARYLVPVGGMVGGVSEDLCRHERKRASCLRGRTAGSSWRGRGAAPASSGASPKGERRETLAARARRGRCRARLGGALRASCWIRRAGARADLGMSWSRRRSSGCGWACRSESCRPSCASG